MDGQNLHSIKSNVRNAINKLLSGWVENWMGAMEHLVCEVFVFFALSTPEKLSHMYKELN